MGVLDTPSMKSTSPDLAETLRDTEQVDALFPPAATIAGVSWLLLLILLYGFTPHDQFVYLDFEERLAALIAFVAMTVTTVSVSMPFCYHRKPSGIIRAAVVISSIAMITNFLLCFAPTVVLVDPVTHARVYLLRWIEWTPLGGLMTFMSEVVDAPKDNKGGLRASIGSALMQSLSIFCGLLLPMCADIRSWTLVMGVSFATYLTIFPRCIAKQKTHNQGIQGSSFLHQEYRDRIKFASSLIISCAVIWTVLVLLYFFNMMAFMKLPHGHPLRRSSLPMILDTFFDIIAKAIYMEVIVGVHTSVFHAAGRTERQMAELRNLMRILWDSSSDCIMISVRESTSTTALFSSAFHDLIGYNLPSFVKEHNAASIMVVLNESPEGTITTAAHFTEANNLQSGKTIGKIICPVDSECPGVRNAEALVRAMWHNSIPSLNTYLVEKEVQQLGGRKRQCEMKVSRHSEKARIGIVRDVSERYRVLEAERVAHSQTLERQKEAQQINRFTRHEVKNGLLACIELCDNLKSQAQFSDDSSERSSSSQKHLGSSKNTGMDELEKTLNEILDTVLAEAMARDVIHEIYNTRPERIDVKGLLASLGISNDLAGRFSVSAPNLPYIRLDPQLLRHIVRNAISNALKYGKKDGAIESTGSFDRTTGELVISVVNEPGECHEDLLAMGDSAAAAVFTQGSRLHAHHLEGVERRNLSAGDGAWIMQKCAKSLGGNCEIKFCQENTTFTLRCPAEALYVTEWPDAHNFEVPPNTWALAIDDSKIQRRLLSRIFAHVGATNERCIVVGEHTSDLALFESTLFHLMEEHPDGRFLMLVDENLDYTEQVFSGSLMMERILNQMDRHQQSRVLALVRSANDSTQDVATYTSRTHGFFPKQAMNRERVREILAPFWAERFFCIGNEEDTLSTTDTYDSSA